MKTYAVYLQINENDKSMLNICSKNPKGEYVLWAVVHSDILTEFDDGWSIESLEECERELCLKDNRDDL